MSSLSFKFLFIQDLSHLVCSLICLLLWLGSICCNLVVPMHQHLAFLVALALLQGLQIIYMGFVYLYVSWLPYIHLVEECMSYCMHIIQIFCFYYELVLPLLFWGITIWACLHALDCHHYLCLLCTLIYHLCDYN